MAQLQILVVLAVVVCVTILLAQQGHLDKVMPVVILLVVQLAVAVVVHQQLEQILLAEL